MLSILRTRTLVLPRFSSTTRQLSATSTCIRPICATSIRNFARSHAAFEYGNQSRGQSLRRHTSEGRPIRLSKNQPSATLWVGNIPFSAHSKEIEDLLSEFGQIRAVRMGTAPSGESKGYAHVDFVDEAAARSVMQANEESQFFLTGRGLFMDYAGPPPSKNPFPPSNTLHISNYSGNEQLLLEALNDFRDVIKSIRIMRNPQTKETLRFGFIEFVSLEDAKTVMEKFQGREIAYGEALTLSYARGKRAVTPPPRFDQGGEHYSFGARRESPGGGDGQNYRSQEGEENDHYRFSAGDERY